MAARQRKAALTLWTQVRDRSAFTEPARAKSPSSIEWHETKVDPNGEMDPVTRRKAAEASRKLYYLELSRRGVEARRAKKAAEAAR